MVFSTASFLFFFLPLFMAAYFLTPGISGKNFVTLAFSLVFYGWGEPTYLFTLLSFIVFNAFAARAIDERDGYARKLAVAAAVAVNLAALAVFKYAGFISSNANFLLRPFGFELPVPHISLPPGVSFFTFHCLSYVIDVYRRRFPANRKLSEVALYIALFPQLIAGPIVRYGAIARQLRARRFTLGRVSAGARIFIIGLAQKTLIADQVAPLAEAAFDLTPVPSLIDAWTGLLAYTVQVYFDFSGYSNMAIGIGLVLGFALPRNFRLPYVAQSITEFWRRWHMSLSAWLRDYLYIPLGGNRGSVLQTYRNLVVVFLLCGLWHGANWNCVLWGAWHGAFLVAERAGLAGLLQRLPAAARWAYTMLAFMGSLAVFRPRDLDGVGAIYAGLLGWTGVSGASFDVRAELQPVAILALLAGCVLAVRPPRTGLPKSTGPALAVTDGAWTFGLLVLAMTQVAAGAYSPFLYFKF